MKIYTIGHSTRSIEEFIDILKHYNIELIIDVRKFPTSKKFPHFNKENLEQTLQQNKIEYLHYPELGGFREGGYEAFTKTNEFKQALEKLLEIVDGKNAAITCAERDFWRCHRKYIADELSHMRHQVIHIQDKQKTYDHRAEKEKMDLRIWCDKKIKHKHVKINLVKRERHSREVFWKITKEGKKMLGSENPLERLKRRGLIKRIYKFYILNF